MIYYFFVFYVGIISSSIIYRVIHIPSGISDLCGPATHVARVCRVTKGTHIEHL